jgi:hypothetical protein
MGWTGSQYVGNSRKEFLIKEFSQENTTHKWYLTDVSMKGAVCYCIHWVEDKTTGTKQHEALVILTEKRRGDDGWIYYKNMGESCGPYYYGAPVSLIKKLNKLGLPFNTSAQQWREQCLANASKEKLQLDFGSIVLFEKPLRFTVRSGSFSCNQFQLVKYGNKRNIFKADDGQIVRISDWKKRQFTVLGVSHV